jgi:uncharacterized protein DUF1761
MNVDVNYLAVFLAAASTMVVGSIWYARGVFGNVWAKLAKVNMDRKVKPAEMVYMMGGTFLVSLVTAYVLAHVAFLSNNYFQNSFLQDTLTTAFWVWLGFTAARFFTHDAFEGRRKKLTLLNVVHELITFMVMGLVIGLLGING